MVEILKGWHVYAATKRGATITGIAIESWSELDCKPIRVRIANGSIVPVLPDQCEEFSANTVN